MNDLNTFLAVGLEILGIITIIGGVTAVIGRWLSPYKELKEKVNKHDLLFEKKDEKLQKIEEGNKMQCKCLLVILDHLATGNGKETIKKTRKEVEEFFINY